MDTARLTPQPLPLLHPMEERDGVRRRVLDVTAFLSDAPHPDPLPARFSRGEGENHLAKSLLEMLELASLYYGQVKKQKLRKQKAEIGAKREERRAARNWRREGAVETKLLLRW